MEVHEHRCSSGHFEDPRVRAIAVVHLGYKDQPDTSLMGLVESEPECDEIRVRRGADNRHGHLHPLTTRQLRQILPSALEDPQPFVPEDVVQRIVDCDRITREIHDHLRDVHAVVGFRSSALDKGRCDRNPVLPESFHVPIDSLEDHIARRFVGERLVDGYGIAIRGDRPDFQRTRNGLFDNGDSGRVARLHGSSDCPRHAGYETSPSDRRHRGIDFAKRAVVKRLDGRVSKGDFIVGNEFVGRCIVTSLPALRW